ATPASATAPRRSAIPRCQEGHPLHQRNSTRGSATALSLECRPMLIGAHVSTAGGLTNAIDRGTELGCESIQIFNQSPRMWRPTRYGPDDFAAFREAMDSSPVEAAVIHAVYLINCATKDRELRKKSLASLTHALRPGDGIGAAGVVLHPGAQKGEPLTASMKRAAKVIAAALEDSESCPLLLEQTAGHKGLLGRDFDQTAELIELA